MKIKWSLDINTGAVERSEAARARRLAGATVVGDDVIASTGYMKKQPCRSKFVMATFLSLAVRHLTCSAIFLSRNDARVYCIHYEHAQYSDDVDYNLGRRICGVNT